MKRRLKSAWETRPWIVGAAGLAVVALALAPAAILAFGGTAAKPAPPTASTSPGHHAEDDESRGRDRDTQGDGCDRSEAACRSQAEASTREPGRVQGDGKSTSGGTGEPTSAPGRPAGGTGEPAEEADAPAEPAEQSAEEGAREGGGSKPHANPDHYGAGGEPASPPSEPSSEVARGDGEAPSHDNPDHYGAGGEPATPPSEPSSEAARGEEGSQPNVNPDESGASDAS